MRVLALGWEVAGPGVVIGEFPSAESFASFDAVLVDPEPLPDLWRPHAALEPDGVWRLHPERDYGLSRALERLFSARRGELEDLLLRGGGALGVRVRDPGAGVEVPGNPPRRYDRYAFLPRASLVAGPHHLALPGGLRFVPRRGRDLLLPEPAHPLTPYLEGVGGYEAVIVSALGAPLGEFGTVLARNRVGDAVALDLRVGPGRVLFLPAGPGDAPSGALLAGLAALLAEPLPPDLPDWIGNYPLPGEEALAARERELAEREARIRAEREELRREREKFDRLRALISPRGLAGFLSAVGAALEALGFAVASGEGPATLRAAAPEGELLVRAALSPFEPVGPGEHRALLLDLDRLRTAGEDVRGMLVCLAEPRLDPRRRGPQWTEAVRRGCADHRLVLASAYDLFKAVRHVLGGASPDPVRRALFSTEGEWRWKG